MADRIIANTETYEELISKLNKLTNQLNSCLASLNRVHAGQYGSLGMNLSGKLQSVGLSLSGSSVSSSLSSLRSALNNLGDRSARLSRSVNKARELFVSNENGLVGLYSGSAVAAAGAIGKIASSTAYGPLAGDILRLTLGDRDVAFWDPAHAGEYRSADFGSLPLFEQSGSMRDFLFLTGPIGLFPESRFSLRMENNDFCTALGMYGMVETAQSGYRIKVNGREVDAGGFFTLLHGEGGIDIGPYHFGNSTDIGKFDATARYRDDANAFGGSIGLSGTALSTTFSHEYEVIDGIGMKEEYNVTAGQADAHLTNEFAYEDGHISYKFGAGLEATGVSVSKTSTYSIFGVDITVGSGAGVGAGGHVDGEITDTSVAVDISGAIGGEADLYLKVDVSKALEKAPAPMRYIHKAGVNIIGTGITIAKSISALPRRFFGLIA